MKILDSIVFQITDLANGGTGERMLAQQSEVRNKADEITIPHKGVNLPYEKLPTEVKSAYDIVKAHCQTELDAQDD